MYKTGLALFWAIAFWSGINPKDCPTWVMETLPAFIGMTAVIPTRKGFPLTPLAYWLIVAHSIVLLIGVVSRNLRKFCHPNSNSSTSASRSNNLPSLCKV